MEINLNNYEAFFLDYKEGTLSPEQEKELFLFLEQYPHLHEELHGYEEIILETGAGEEIYENKNSVKKIDFTNEDLIAYTEGIIDERSKSDIDVLAYQNHSFKKELELYKSTHIAADLNIKFPNKSKLKRGGIVIVLQNNYTFLRMAAAILLLIGIFFLVSKFTTKEESGKNKIKLVNVSKKAKGSQQLAADSQKKMVNSRQSEEGSLQKADNKKQKNINKIIPQPEIQNVATTTVQTNSAIANNVNNIAPKDSVNEILVSNDTTLQIPVINKSYFNSYIDKDDESTQPVTASLNPGKRSFFQKLIKVAKDVNNLGVKKINASEKNNSNSLTIGGLVVAETTSN